MEKVLEKYLFKTEYVFEDKYTTKNQAVYEVLTPLINKLSQLKKEEWLEIFTLMGSNSLSKKVNEIEAYSIATSKIITGNAQEENLFFAKDGKTIALYTSKYWIKLDRPLLQQFLKTAANKVGIPENIASRVTFVNKLQKQFMQDSYIEKIQTNNLSFVNLNNGVVVISQDSVEFENHNPRFFLNYFIDIEYDESKIYPALKSDTLSFDVWKSLQQSIAQVLINKFSNNKKICLYGLDYNLMLSLIETLEQIMPKDLITKYFTNMNAKLEDLFLDYKAIKKEPDFLNMLTIIPCDADTLKNLISSENQEAVFHWLIDGAREIIKNQCVYVAQECEEVKSRFNLVSLFVQELNLIKTPKNSKSIVSTYDSILKQYESFCELHDEEPFGRGKFNKELKALGFESTRRESGNVWFAKFA